MANDLDQSVSNAIASGVSGPVDLITWLLRKGGLPVDKPVGGSDWMREKGLTREVKPGAGQVVGETVGSLVDPLSSLGAGAKGAILLANGLRPDLITSHAVSASKLLRGGEVPRELYNPSFGITKNKLMSFDDNTVRLIPRIGKFDPKTSPSVLTAIDSYTPRYQKGAGHRVDDALENAAVLTPNELLTPEELHQYMRELGAKRVADKLVSVYPKGGIFGETADKSSLRGLPQYGRGGYDVSVGIKPFADDAMHRQSIGKRFQSLAEYERSPYGAGRLDDGRNHRELSSDIDSFLAKYVPGIDLDNSQERLQRLLTLSKDMPSFVSTQKAKHYLNELRKTASEYGELKQYGPVQINPSNFAGATVRTEQMFSNASETAKAVVKGLRARGIPVVEHGFASEHNPQALFDIASEMQRNAK